MYDRSGEINEDLIRNFLIEQVPGLAEMAIRYVTSSGTDNILYRLGDRLVLRLPKREEAVALLAKELDWVSHFSDLPLCVPELHCRGKTEIGLKDIYGIFVWMEGDIASPDNISDPLSASLALAEFLEELQKKETIGAPVSGEENCNRGVSLERLDAVVLESIEVIADEIDSVRACALWHEACAVPYSGPPVWVHGDLKADNLFAQNGNLVGVIDWGLAAVGDPAADYAVAWSWVDVAVRDNFIEACRLSDNDKTRAMGWALYGAVISLSYYRGGLNETLCTQSRNTLSRLNLLL